MTVAAARLPLAGLLAAGVAFLLFGLMQHLVAPHGPSAEAVPDTPGIRFGPVDIPDEIVEKTRRRPDKPPPPDRPPPPPRMPLQRIPPVEPRMPQMDMPRLEVPLGTANGLYLGQAQAVDPTAEGDVVPVVVIRPMYPREAAMSGIEGWVKLEFTITENGEVRNPRVLDAEPARIFNREAIRAILKWKFKPRVVDGVAVERQATQTIDFTLQEPSARQP